ncbi:MAG TPA: hypothetical protein VF666_06205 [Pyrinomonadaceae bacterium]|jgi:hypothetical protein
MTPQDHNKALGILHLAYGGVHLLLLTIVSLFLFLAVSGAAFAVPFDNGELPVTFFILALIWTVGALLTLPPLVAGYAILKRKSWGRLAGIVAGIVSALNFPFGMALCIYSLWFFFGEGRALYDTPLAWETRQQPYTLREDASDASTFGWNTQRKSSDERERVYVPPLQPPDWRS